MRTVFFLFLILLSFSTSAQKVECRNDSIFVNNFYIHSATGKSILDSILNSKGKIKQHPGKDLSAQHKKIKITSYYYDQLGLIFSKYDYDSTKLSITIKLYRNSDPRADKSNMAMQLFTGDLFFANNHISERRRLEQYQGLKDCKTTYYRHGNITVPGFPFAGFYAANIVHQKSSMYVSCELGTDEVITAFISN